MAEEDKVKEDAPKQADVKTDAKAEAAPVEEKKAKIKLTAEQKKRSKRRSVVEGNLHVHASYNNTIITITELNGDVISWASAGGSGFKGARKATPYAAQVAAENAVQKAKIYGLERVHAYVKGVGSGRDQAMRGVAANDIELLSITDITGMPHNGCRKKKKRRV